MPYGRYRRGTSVRRSWLAKRLGIPKRKTVGVKVNMKTRALIALWVGVGLMVLMGLFPPWLVYTYRTGNDMPMPGMPLSSYGYAFLFNPPWTLGSRPGQYAFVDLSRLIVQWVVVASVTVALVLTLNRGSASSETKESAAGSR